MLNQYSYSTQNGDTTLYSATGTWNGQLASKKIINTAENYLWGWDATESHQSVSTITVTDDDPTTTDQTQTNYIFEVATYRLFENELSSLNIQVGAQLFYKVGVKIFNGTFGDSTEELANGISNYMELTVPTGATWMSMAGSGLAALLTTTTLISLF